MEMIACLTNIVTELKDIYNSSTALFVQFRNGSTFNILYFLGFTSNAFSV